jgi:hypothetical protein
VKGRDDFAVHCAGIERGHSSSLLTHTTEDGVINPVRGEEIKGEEKCIGRRERKTEIKTVIGVSNESLTMLAWEATMRGGSSRDVTTRGIWQARTRLHDHACVVWGACEMKRKQAKPATARYFISFVHSTRKVGAEAQGRHREGE